MVKIDHKPGEDIIRELARMLYPSSMHSFREAISNSFDEESRRIEITIDNFKRFITFEDWGHGIRDVDKFFTFGENLKRDYNHGNKEIIGQKGLGKLSLLRFQDKILFYSNNGTEDMKIEMLLPPEPNDVQYKYAGHYLDHKGIKIIIENAFPDEIPDVKKLKDYLETIFSLRIKQGAQILLNKEYLEPSKDIDPEEHFLFRLKGGLEIRGNIKEDRKNKREMGYVKMHCKKVLVQRVEVDEADRRCFSGWLNCNDLQITTNRDAVIEDRLFKSLMEHLKQWTKKFAKVEVDPQQITHSDKLITNEIGSLIKKYMKDMKISLPPIISGKSAGRTGKNEDQTKSELINTAQQGESVTGSIIGNPTGVGPLPPPPPPGPKGPTGTIDSEGGNQQGLVQTTKPIKRHRGRSPDLEWHWDDYGNDRDPIFFAQPNIVICNMTNDIYKVATEPRIGDAYHGPVWLRLAPYLGRMFVKMKPDSKTYTVDQMIQEVDDATRYILKQYKAI